MGCGQILGPVMAGRSKYVIYGGTKNKALQLYGETGSIAKVIHTLGYPSRQNMYTWIKIKILKRKKYDFTDSSKQVRFGQSMRGVGVFYQTKHEEKSEFFQASIFEF